MVTKDIINLYVKKGLISETKHPDFDLWIYNYTPQVQYDKLWDEVTLNTRGLILDINGNVIARGFSKFFNLEELGLTDIPNESFDVTTKLDGSLGITYNYNNKFYIATRGSFTSDQAIVANEILYSKYSHLLDRLDKDKIYQFEILFPENRIVVNYGGTRDIILLNIMDKMGNDLPMEDIGFPIVKKHNGILDFSALKNLNIDNEEGFVIRFKSGFRMKIKFEEYVRLHRILTNISSRHIWEYLKDNLPMDEILERVPDEFYDWVKNVKSNLENEYKLIELQSIKDFKLFDNRKDAAEYYKTCDNPGILFNMLDNRDYSKYIWKLIKPTYEKPFKNEK